MSTFSFKVSKFQSFNFLNFQRFKVSKVHKFHFMFFIDIDPISKIFKNLLDGSSGFIGPRLSQHFQNLRFPNFKDVKIQYFSKTMRDFLNNLESFGVYKIKYNWFGESWSRPLDTKTKKMLICVVFPQ